MLMLIFQGNCSCFRTNSAHLVGHLPFSKSATIVNLIKKEFWRIFPAGTSAVPPDTGARIEEEMYDGNDS